MLLKGRGGQEKVPQAMANTTAHFGKDLLVTLGGVGQEELKQYSYAIPWDDGKKNVKT